MGVCVVCGSPTYLCPARGDLMSLRCIHEAPQFTITRGTAEWLIDHLQETGEKPWLVASLQKQIDAAGPKTQSPDGWGWSQPDPIETQ